MDCILPLGERRFTMADQTAFAALSGDANPMHIDPLRARRTQAGAPVVHGVHAALWALDALYADQELPPPTAIKARFDRFIYLDEPVQATVNHRSQERADIDLLSSGGRVAKISLTLGSMRAAALVNPRPQPDSPPTEPRDRPLEALKGASGSFAFARPDDEAAAAFPAFAASVGGRSINSLIALSTLVGMHCPGLHSIFSKLAIGFVNDRSKDATLAYRVRRVQPLLRLVNIDVEAPGLAGSVECFVRQPPVRQPSTGELRGKVAAGSFAGARVLVVGGSRGLGEMTAKLLSLGGAESVVTYASGADDAEAVAADIRAAGGACRTMHFDARKAPAPQFKGRDGDFTQLYYYATPQIFRKSGTGFSSAALAGLLEIYVTGFYNLCRFLDHGRGLRVFYPSSVAIDERPKGTVEYVMAKAAGEILCSEIARDHPQLDIVIERLPRLLTDQTATVLPVESAPVVETLLPIIRRMHKTEALG